MEWYLYSLVAAIWSTIKVKTPNADTFLILRRPQEKRVDVLYKLCYLDLHKMANTYHMIGNELEKSHTNKGYVFFSKINHKKKVEGKFFYIYLGGR